VGPNRLSSQPPCHHWLFGHRSDILGKRGLVGKVSQAHSRKLPGASRRLTPLRGARYKPSILAQEV
jgi:hypothetical protein